MQIGVNEKNKIFSKKTFLFDPNVNAIYDEGISPKFIFVFLY